MSGGGVFGDLSPENEQTIVGEDGIGNLRKVQTIVRSDGLVAIPTDGKVTVESTFGYDSLPDSYFRIIDTGAEGNTWTIDIAGTSIDPSSPDRDVPAFNKVFTVLAGEVGDELALRDRMISELNQDTIFRDTVHCKSFKATDRAIVHISSEKFSLNGEDWERPLAGDFDVTVTGTAHVVVGFDNFISRSKPISISRDPDSPHNLGVFGISGSVFVTAKELDDLFIEEATHVTHGNDMLQDGSGTPIDFTVDASADTDVFIETLIFDLGGNGIKFGQFGSKSGSGLANGVEVEIKSDNITTTLPLIKLTEDFKNKFAALSGDGGNFRIDVQAGQDEMLAIFSFPNPFVLKVAGTFGAGNDDYVQVKIQDNISSGVSRFNFRVKGFEKEP